MKNRARAVIQEHTSDPLYRHSYLLLGSAGISAASGFVFWIIAARLASAEVVGRSGALVSAVALLSYLTSLGLPYGLLRFGARDRGLSSSINVALCLTIGSSMLASVIFVAGVNVWTPALAGLVHTPSRLLFFTAMNVGAALVVMLDNVFAARRAAQVPLLRSFVSAVGRLAALPLLVGLGAIGIYFAALAPTAIVVAIVLIGLPLLIPRYHVRELRLDDGAGELIRYSLSTYPAALLGGAPPFFIPLIALSVVGSRETAYFYIAWSLLAVFLFVPSIISNMSLSEGSRDLPWRTADRARKFAVSIIVPVTIVLLVLSGPLLSLFGPAYAAHGTWPLRVFAISLVPWTFYNINQAALRADSHHRDLTIVSTVFALMTLLGPIILGLVWGLVGLAAGWTLGVSVTSLVLTLLAIRHRRSERATLAAQAAPPEELQPEPAPWPGSAFAPQRDFG